MKLAAIAIVLGIFAFSSAIESDERLVEEVTDTPPSSITMYEMPLPFREAVECTALDPAKESVAGTLDFSKRAGAIVDGREASIEGLVFTVLETFGGSWQNWIKRDAALQRDILQHSIDCLSAGNRHTLLIAGIAGER